GEAEIGAGEEPVSLATVEGDGQRLAFAGETGELHQEIHVPGLAPHLTVGDPLQPGFLLELDAVSYRRILGRRELGDGRPARLFLQPERLEGCRTQEAAHVIGTEGRPGISHVVPPRRHGRDLAGRRCGAWELRPAPRSPSPPSAAHRSRAAGLPLRPGAWRC